MLCFLPPSFCLPPQEESSSWGHALQTNKSIQIPYTPNHLSASHTLGHHCSALITPESSTRGLEKFPIPQNPLKVFNLANPMPGYSALPAPSHRSHKKGFCPQLPLAPFASRPTLVLLCGAPMAWCTLSS